jgi:dTDP-4-dehydrorhamnose reductase
VTATPRIVVLGSAGQLGRDLCARLPGEVIALTRADAELTDHAAVTKALSAHQPQIVINCAAWNLVDKAEDEPLQAFAVNTLTPRCLAQASKTLGFLLVHFSTDYVYGLDAQRSTPYLESDAPGPVSIYGLSKLAGEYCVRAAGPEHLVIRTCGLYGRHGSGGKGGNFVETMLKLAAQGKPLRVVADQVLTPSSTTDVAAATVELIQRGARGLRHVTNSGQCSWFEFARVILELAGVQAELSPTTSEAYGARAKRPAFSVLQSEHPDTPKLRPWREALAEYLLSGQRLVLG